MIGGAPPRDDVTTKPRYPIVNRSEKGSTIPPREWSMAKAPFAILLDERFIKAKAAQCATPCPHTEFLTVPSSEDDVLAYMHFPASHRIKLHSTNPLERINKEIKRRADVVGIFPNEASITRLILPSSRCRSLYQPDKPGLAGVHRGSCPKLPHEMGHDQKNLRGVCSKAF